jgi:hypothetical protein
MKKKPLFNEKYQKVQMGERRDLNPRMVESQSTALPLGYARHFLFQKLNSF